MVPRLAITVTPRMMHSIAVSIETNDQGVRYLSASGDDPNRSRMEGQPRRDTEGTFTRTDEAHSALKVDTDLENIKPMF